MKNSCLALIIFILICSSLRAENLLIESKNITIDKKNEISIFQDDVLVITAEKNEIKSDYAEYNRKKGFIKFKNNIVAKDNSNNIIIFGGKRIFYQGIYTFQLHAYLIMDCISQSEVELFKNARI